MNRTLRHIFYVIVALFTILGISSSILMVVNAQSLNSDTRNTRALYHEYAQPRGSILAADGTVLASSTESKDIFSFQRSYSNGPVYSPVTGYFSVTVRADRGIEASRNSQLSGQSSSLWMAKLKGLLSGEKNSGAIITTSIDTKLQNLAYELLQKNGYDGAVVAMEPTTGRILAMASTPSYDPNELASHNTSEVANSWTQLASSDSSPLINRATSQLYSPGSTFKVVVAAAALESGNYQPDTMIPAGSEYTLPGTTTVLPNSVSRGDGTNGQISLINALTYSSNTAFAQLGVTLGQDAVANMAKKLGYGSTINIDGTDSIGVPMQATASKFPSNLSADKLALSSIGQSDVRTTPLLNAMIASTVANNGVMLKPTLVDSVRASDLSIISERSTTTLSEAFSADTAGKLNTMMQSVVDNDTPTLKISNIKIAAKTGTAELGNGTNNGWLMGFAPADGTPKIAISVVLHGIKGYGIQEAGPIMRSLIQEYLS
ncbi:penicillin-binding protein [Alloscardovia macacae]|uniref:Penicillin-binding protein n=1 Tax=Alloscardovia macacae TaxID=1160091 RepID=A0A1Y2SY62_9BIFI|nr:penicillin-binding transpeptidase domain-containing protein [Alloscardovia macacae]OTA26852.1 penicillin-binding protein [Alloscardovia macacae]OTA29123.1 penicillin-binding protein [Alloscardovia macacae]